MSGGETNEECETTELVLFTGGLEGVTVDPPSVHFLPTKVLKASLVTWSL